MRNFKNSEILLFNFHIEDDKALINYYIDIASLMPNYLIENFVFLS